jgi:predicted CXXCH cytochrome family protein
MSVDWTPCQRWARVPHRVLPEGRNKHIRNCKQMRIPLLNRRLLFGSRFAGCTRDMTFSEAAHSAKHSKWPILIIVVGVLASARIVLTQRLSEPQSGPSVSWKLPISASPPDQLVGNDGCRSCHRAEVVQFMKTSHSRLESKGTPVLTCESCHGPGKAHVEGQQAARGDEAKTLAANRLIFSFRASPKENSERCLTCHNTSKQQDSFEHSGHMSTGVSCNDCHSTHLVNEAKDLSRGEAQMAQPHFFQVPQRADEARWLQSSLLKSSQPDLCFTCHANVRGQFAQPVHHRVPEGFMKCTDCHKAHGRVNPPSLVKTRTETCGQCHMDKREPFVYEHPAAKVDGCVVCHNPHGSANRMLLVRREGRQLCLQCHTGFHLLTQAPHGRLGFQTSGECTRCHVAIHGSNSDRYLLR